MKKILMIITAGLTLWGLAGCRPADHESQSSNQTSTEISQAVTVQATIQFKGLEAPKEVTTEVDDGTTLLTVLEENCQVEAKDGFVTSIDGVAQDEGAGKYWTFTINGEWGEKGAADTILKDGDEVVFTYGEI